MAKQNKNKAGKSKTGPLEGFKLALEDPYPRNYLSKTAGQHQRFSIIRRVFGFMFIMIASFMIDVYKALKSIYKEIDNV